MKGCALIAWNDHHFSLEQVELPDPAPNQIRIKTHYSGVSIGTEFAYITGKGKIAGKSHPMCTGYRATGTVQAVGKDVHNFKEGDLTYFRAGAGIKLSDGTPVSSLFGTHASAVVLDPRGVDGAYHMVPGVDLESASLYVMPAVALKGVDTANPRMGETVVVFGCGLIGLGVVASLVHRGCTVIAVDLVTTRLRIAQDLGADHVLDAATNDVKEELLKLAPKGADVVFECTGSPASIDPAIDLCRHNGSFVWQGYYGIAPLSMLVPTPQYREVTMHFPCGDGHETCRRAVLRNMQLGTLQWHKCITHHASYEEAADIYSRISNKDDDIVGVTINWTDV